MWWSTTLAQIKKKGLNFFFHNSNKIYEMSWQKLSTILMKKLLPNSRVIKKGSKIVVPPYLIFLSEIIFWQIDQILDFKFLKFDVEIEKLALFDCFFQCFWDCTGSVESTKMSAVVVHHSLLFVQSCVQSWLCEGYIFLQ